jgi:trimeric autotransporter adhesin
MVAIVLSANPEVHGQAIDRLTPVTSPAPRVALLNHHPQWANKENSTGLVAPDFALEQLTLVLSRSAQQEEDLQAFLAQQQDPRSPNYHRWLTPAEMGQRFGVSEQDVATLSAWLQSQGLHVNWVSPSRMFLRFGGTASAVGHAFQTELHTPTQPVATALSACLSLPIP